MAALRNIATNPRFPIAAVQSAPSFTPAMERFPFPFRGFRLEAEDLYFDAVTSASKSACRMITCCASRLIVAGQSPG
jgi:hypothetical protein